MSRWWLTAVLACCAGVGSPSTVDAQQVVNPDEITIVFARLEGAGNLGQNVATVLSLQLAQTGRRAPWPENPEGHDFNQATVVWSDEELDEQTHDAAESLARALDVTAQISIWGETYAYGGSVLADLNVTLPRYSLPGEDCRDSVYSCDFRQANFEVWTVTRGAAVLSVGPPRRRFAISAIALKPEIVETFTSAEGLPIRSTLSGGNLLGYTEPALLFLEFNPKLPGAPSKVTSGGITGYVTLPELTEGASEFSDLIGGIMRIFRGDWDFAKDSFRQVLENPASRLPTRVDAHLYLGMILARSGETSEALDHLQQAHALAPYSKVAVQYLVQGYLTEGSESAATQAADLLARSQRLFAADDRWFAAAREMVGSFE
jgi:tetratricopeptide (TPR) repeat protein